MIFTDFYDFVVFGPKAPGAHGTLHCLTFFEIVWDHLGCVWGVVRGP